MRSADLGQLIPQRRIHHSRVRRGWRPRGLLADAPHAAGVAAGRGRQGALVPLVKDVLSGEATIAQRAGLELLEHPIGRGLRATSRDLGRQVGGGEPPRIPMLTPIGLEGRHGDRAGAQSRPRCRPIAASSEPGAIASRPGARFESSPGAGPPQLPGDGFGAPRARTTPPQRNGFPVRRSQPATNPARPAGSRLWQRQHLSRDRPLIGNRHRGDERGVVEDSALIIGQQESRRAHRQLLTIAVGAASLAPLGARRARSRFVAPSSRVCYKGAVFSNRLERAS